MDLNESLRAAVADPPPTRIDLDTLIRGEQRREYRQRWVLGAGVVSGVAVLIGAAGVIIPGGSRSPVADGGLPCPWVSPTVDPSATPSYLPPPSVSPPAVPRSPSMSFSSGSPFGSGSPFEGGSGSPSMPTSDLPSMSGSGSPPYSPPYSPSYSLPDSPSNPPANSSASVQPPPPVVSSIRGDPVNPSPYESPSELCGDTLRRLEHVLTDALARIAPNAPLATPVRFFNYPDGTVRATVVFADRSVLQVILLPLWSTAYDQFKLEFATNGAKVYDLHGRGLVIGKAPSGPLTADQLLELSKEPGLTLNP